MRIYITDLQAYNEGHLIASWYELPMDENLLAESIENELQRGKVICNSQQQHHEEYFISDYECSYMEIGEYDNIEKLNDIAETMDSVDENGIKSIKFLLENNLVKDFDEALAIYEDNVRIYEDSTMEDIAYDLINECYSCSLENIPDIIANNIDYEKIGRDLEIEGSYYKVGSDIYEYIG